MKKLAMLLALVMSCNLFAATLASAVESTNDNLLFDFNNESVATKNAPAPADGWAHSSSSLVENVAAVIDDEHGVSMGYASQSGYMYNFDGGLPTNLTIEFDLYVDDATDTSGKVYYSGTQGDFGGDMTYFWTGETANAITFPNSTTYPIKSDTWYKIRIDVYDNSASNASRPYLVKYYVNGNFVRESTRTSMSGLSIRARGKTTYEYIDNVAFYTYTADPTPLPTATPIPGAEYFDFNNETAVNSSATPPEGWAHGSGAPGDNMIVNVNDKTGHGLSLGHKGQSGWMYEFGENITTDTTIEFDLYVDNPTEDTNIAWYSGIQNDRGDAHFFNIKNNENILTFSNGSTVEIQPKLWYRIKIILSYDSTETKPILAQYYVDGKYISQSRRNNVNAFFGRSFGGTRCHYIDNVSLYSKPAATPAPTEEPEPSPFVEVSWDFEGETPLANLKNSNVAVTTVDGNNVLEFTGSGGNIGKLRSTPITESRTVSFKFMSDDTSFNSGLLINAGSGNGSSTDYIGRFKADNWWGDGLGSATIFPGVWYNVTVNYIFDGESEDPTLEVYLNDDLLGSKTFAADIYGFKITNESLTGGNYYVDDVVYKPYEAPVPSKNVFIDFNNGTGENIMTDEPLIYNADLPEALTWDETSSDTYKLGYRFADNEHNSSLSIGGAARFYYQFEENMTDDVRVSFEMRTTGENVSTTEDAFYLQTGLGGLYDKATMIMRQSGAEIILNQVDTTFAFLPHQWYKFDIIFNYDEENSKYITDIYMNGDLKRTMSTDVLDYLYFIGKQRDGANNMIDNLKIEYLSEEKTSDTFNVEAKTIAPDAIEDNYLELKFDETIDIETWDEDGATVTKKVGSDAETTVAVSYAQLNETRDGAIIWLDEELSYNARYTITLPSEVRSIYGKPLQLSKAIASTTTEEFNLTPTPRCWGSVKDENNNPINVQVGAGTASMQGSAGAYVGISPVGGIVKISFDADASKIEGVDGTNLPYLTLNDVDTVASYGKWPVRGNGTLIWFEMDEATEMTHYDVLVNLETGEVTYVVNSEEIVTMPYRLTTLKQIAFNSHEHANLDIANLNITYHDSIAEFTTDLTEVVNPSRTSIAVSFVDTPNVSTLLSGIALYKVGNNNSLDLVTFNPGGDNPTEAITLDGLALEDGASYVLDMSGVRTTLGVPYQNSIIRFKAVGFLVNDVAILDGATEITNSWDKTKAYTVSVDAVNNNGSSRTVQAVVAGYSAEALVGVQVVPVTIDTTGAATAPMTALDLTGATSIRVFVLNDLDSLAPILQTPALYSIAQ